MDILEIKNNTIIVCSNNEKKNLLKKLNESDKLLPIKFLSKSDFIKALTFLYDEKTLYYVRKKYNVKIEVAKEYLDNIYYVSDKKYDNDKLDFLVNLKKDLIENKLLKTDELFINSLKGKDIIIYNLGYIDNFLSKLLDNIKSVCNVKIVNKENETLYSKKVYRFTHIDDEVNYIACQICKLVKYGVDINKIKLIISDNEYINIVKRVFKMYNIPVNLNDNICLYFTLASKYLISNFTSDLTKVIEEVKDKYSTEVVNKLLNVINKFTFIEDKLSVKEDIIYLLQNTYLPEIKYDNAVELSTFDSVNEDNYVFLLGFNQKTYPTIYKDEDYLLDEEKSLLGLEKSYELAKKDKENLIYNIRKLKNLFISYKLQSESGSFLPSTLISEMNMETITDRVPLNYSNKYNKIKLCSLLDRFYKYSEVNEELKTLYNNYKIDYKLYDNTYKKVPFELMNKIFKNKLYLSYSSMEGYNECGFKYLINNVLRLDVYEDTFAAFLGSLFHHILELSIDKEIDVHNEIIKYMDSSNRIFTEKEKFYIFKMEKDMIFAIEIIKEQNTYSLLNEYMLEQEFDVNKKSKLDVLYKGFIDKLMYKTIRDKTYYAIVDYKTYDIDVKMDLIDYGLNLQLPIYLYLIKNNYKDALICGFYIQKVYLLDNKYDENKSLLERKKDSLKLTGYSNIDGSIINKLDKDYESSKVIKGLKLKKDGNFYSYSKVLSNEKMDEIYHKVDEQIDKVINNIEDSNFDINPKNYNGKNISCMYCKFKDICYKSIKDEVIIETEDNDGVDC